MRNPMWWMAMGLCCASVPAGAVPVPGTVVLELHPDMRDCLSPMCGGWFVERVNHPTLRCLDGSVAAQCYVLEVDWTALGLDPVRQDALVAAAFRDEVVIRARPYRVNVPGFGDFAGIEPVHAWTAVLP